MSRTGVNDSESVIERVGKKFRSGNAIAVDRAWITADEWSQVKDYNAELERKLSEALAKSERLQDSLDKVANPDWNNMAETDQNLEKARNVLNETPAQSLREVQAEAGYKGFRVGFRAGFATPVPSKGTEMEQEAREYAQQVRDGK